MTSSLAYNSSIASPRILILNDSFHNMVDYKAKHNKFPSSYDDMVSFLKEVHIQLYSHGIHLASLHSQIFPIRNAIVFLKLRLVLISHSTKLAIPYSPTHWFFFFKVGASREFFFSGKVELKPSVDLVIADYPDGLPVPGVSEFPRQVPNWNKHVENFIKFTIGFCQGYLHDDGALLIFYPDSVQIKKEILSYLYNNNFQVKEEWTIVNSNLHLTHPMHNSKRVSNCSHFSLFKF